MNPFSRFWVKAEKYAGGTVEFCKESPVLHHEGVSFDGEKVVIDLERLPRNVKRIEVSIK